MKYKFQAVLLSAAILCHGTCVYGAIPDYDTVMKEAKKKSKTVQTFETTDDSGNAVSVAASQENLYVTARTADIYMKPDDKSEVLANVVLGDEVQQNGICDNGWSRVAYENKDGSRINGYIQNQTLSEDIQIQPGTVRVKIIMNGEEKNALTTMLLNDLATYQGTLGPNEETELVVVGEYPVEDLQSIDSLSVKLKNESGEVVLNCD